MSTNVTDFRNCFRDSQIELTQGGRQARLAPTWLMHHEEGVAGDIRQPLDQRNWAKVTFALPPADKPPAAQLLWFVDRPTGVDDDSWWRNTGHVDPTPWILFVNGQRLVHHQEADRMLAGGWDRCDVPAKYLKPGHNEIVFANYGVLYVDPGSGGHSWRSFDGGHTWHAAAFGPEQNTSGEYLVRLRLQAHPSRGVLTSPVIDLADPRDQGRVAPLQRCRSCELQGDSRTPPGTAIQFQIRQGSTPQFIPTHWTPWQTKRRLAKPNRFVQWRATLSTERLDATPVLRRLALKIAAAPRRQPAFHGRLTQWDRPVLRRSSYSFNYLALHPKAQRLVQEYRLEEVVAPGQSDLERLTLLRDWVHKQWSGWQSQAYPYCPAWDPLEILAVTKHNWGYGMCTHFAATFWGCAAALGYVARPLVLDHHLVAEAWVDDLGKWVLFDAAGDCNFIVELNGQPLNALEITRAIQQGQAERLDVRLLRPSWMGPQAVPGIRSGPREVFGQHEFVVGMTRIQTLLYRRIGIALRNNYLVESAPAEKEHGHSHYHWNGYLWWSAEPVPKYPEYSLQTQREADFYWTVGCVRAHLAATNDPGRLEVLLEHTMPNLRHLAVRRANGDWEAVAPQFEWALALGANHLELRAVNVFGRAGAITRLVAEV